MSDSAIDPMPFATGLFGTHVSGRPGVAWPLADILLPQGQPEVGHEWLAALVEQDVPRFDVPMDQPLLVSVVQRLGHRRHQFDRFVDRKPGLLEPRGEVGAVDVLRDDETGELLGAADIEDRDDVRMIEVRDRAGFGQVGFGVFEAIHQLAMRHLDGHRAAQLVVVGQIDEAEPALAQHSFDPVATDAFRELRLAKRAAADALFEGGSPSIERSCSTITSAGSSSGSGRPARGGGRRIRRCWDARRPGTAPGTTRRRPRRDRDRDLARSWSDSSDVSPGKRPGSP